MTVTLTSPALGKAVGATHTGPEEAWLVANGYAKNADGVDSDTVPDDIAYATSFAVAGGNDNTTDYTGAIKADGLNHLASGGLASDILPADDLTLAENREAPQWPNFEATQASTDFANGATGLAATKTVGPYDFDAGSVDNDAPIVLEITPDSGPAGTVVHVNGDNLEGVTAATVGGVAVTGLVVEDNQNLHFTVGAHAAGAVNVVLTDASGNTTVTNGYTYTA